MGKNTYEKSWKVANQRNYEKRETIENIDGRSQEGYKGLQGNKILQFLIGLYKREELRKLIQIDEISDGGVDNDDDDDNVSALASVDG